MKSELHIKFDAPLHKLDTEFQTFGCRANNPDICRFYMLDGICAYATHDAVCKKPSRAWKKQFSKLKEDKSGGI